MANIDSSSEKELDEIYKALSNATRREILKLIGEKGKISYLELSKELGLEAGSVYWHLNKMKKLVKQDENKAYFLSDLGLKALNLIGDKPILVEPVTPKEIVTDSGAFERIYNVLTFDKVYDVLLMDKTRTLIEFVLILFLTSFFCDYTDLMNVLIYFYGDINFELDFKTALFFTTINLIIMAIQIWVVAKILEWAHMIPSKIKLSASFILILPFAMMPLFLFPLVAMILKLFDLDLLTIEIYPGYPLAGAVLLILQLWLYLTLTKHVSRTLEITPRHSSLVVLVVYYLAFALTTIASQFS